MKRNEILLTGNGLNYTIIAVKKEELNMKENVRFYKCPVCGNVIGLIHGEAERITCCGKPMELMVANTADAATEKHVPVYTKAGTDIIVRVGEAEHPMEEDHYIMWIAQVTDNSTTRVRLSPGKPAEATFPYIPGDRKSVV